MPYLSKLQLERHSIRRIRQAMRKFKATTFCCNTGMKQICFIFNEFGLSLTADDRLVLREKYEFKCNTNFVRSFYTRIEQFVYTIKVERKMTSHFQKQNEIYGPCFYTPLFANWIPEYSKSVIAEYLQDMKNCKSGIQIPDNLNQLLVQFLKITILKNILQCKLSVEVKSPLSTLVLRNSLISSNKNKYKCLAIQRAIERYFSTEFEFHHTSTTTCEQYSKVVQQCVQIYRKLLFTVIDVTVNFTRVMVDERYISRINFVDKIVLKMRDLDNISLPNNIDTDQFIESNLQRPSPLYLANGEESKENEMIDEEMGVVQHTSVIETVDIGHISRNVNNSGSSEEEGEVEFVSDGMANISLDIWNEMPTIPFSDRLNFGSDCGVHPSQYPTLEPDRIQPTFGNIWLFNADGYSESTISSTIENRNDSSPLPVSVGDNYSFPSRSPAHIQTDHFMMENSNYMSQYSSECKDSDEYMGNEARPCFQSHVTSSSSTEILSLQEMERDLIVENRRKRQLFEGYLPGIEKMLLSVGIVLGCRCSKCVLVEMKKYKTIVSEQSQLNFGSGYCNSNNNGY